MAKSVLTTPGMLALEAACSVSLQSRNSRSSVPSGKLYRTVNRITFVSSLGAVRTGGGAAHRRPRRRG